MARSGFVTAGSWVVDRNITVDRWPGEDMLATVQGMTLAGGGPGCNFACDMRRLDAGIAVETQGLIGAGEMGDFLLQVAGEHGIGTSGLRRTEAAQTMVTDAYLSKATGRRTHILFFGTAALLSPEHFSFEGCAARYLHLGLPGIHALMDAPWQGDANGWVTVLKAGQAAGLKTNLELVSAPAETIRRIVTPCLAHLDTLVVNDHEIGALAERETLQDGVTDWDACEAAAKLVLERGAMALVAVHFTAGALLVTREGQVLRVPSVRIPEGERVGANGAGDAFAAGFFCGLHREEGLEDCLRLAHATAAASLRAADTYSGVVSAEDCLALAERWGWREVQ